MTSERFHKLACCLLCCSMLTFSACSTTYPVAPSSSERSDNELTYQDVNNKIKGERVRIELKNGTVYQVPQFQFGNDSSAIVRDGQSTPLIVDNRAISSIRTADHTLGAFQGLLFGLLGGMAMGVVVTPSPRHSESGARYWMATLSVAAWSLGGGIVGLIIGTAKGNEKIYPVHDSSESDRSTKENK